MLVVRDMKLLNEKIVNFEARPGELVFIKGKNGSGKSLFLKSLAKIIPSTFREVSLNGFVTSDFTPEVWRSKLLYLPSEVCFSELETVHEFLNVPFRLNCYKDFIPSFDPLRHLQNCHERMDILSSGQKQRVALLRALSLNAEVLLIDECFSQIDSTTREWFMDLFKKFQNEGKIILMVSHFEIQTGHFATREFFI